MSNSEIFEESGIWPSRWLENWVDGVNQDDFFLNEWDVAARDKNRAGFINALFQHALDRNFSHCGFKVLANQLHEPEFKGLARSPDIKKIVLKRRNVLKQFVSKLKADTTNAWYEANSSNVKVHVDIQQFKWFAEDAELCYDKCLIPYMAPGSWHIVVYEDLLDNYDSTMAKVLEFLQYTGEAQFTWGAVKHKSPLSQSIENWMEVVQAFEKTAYGEYLALPSRHAM
jgi:LPS sulfotransferase NodH